MQSGALSTCVLRVYGNPAKFWCYRDEDYVGFIKRICAKTKHPATLEAVGARWDLDGLSRPSLR